MKRPVGGAMWTQLSLPVMSGRGFGIRSPAPLGRARAGTTKLAEVGEVVFRQIAFVCSHSNPNMGEANHAPHHGCYAHRRIDARCLVQGGAHFHLGTGDTEVPSTGRPRC